MIKQILFVEMVSMSLLLSVFFAFATIDKNDDKQALVTGTGTWV